MPNKTDLPKLILSKVLHDDQFCRSLLPYVKGEYFEGTDRIIYKLIMEFVGKYNKRPTKTALEIDAQKSPRVTESNGAEIMSTMTKIFDETYTHVDYDWLYDEAELWCKERALYLAVMESFAIITNGDTKDKSAGIIPEMMTNALSVSFDNQIGHDYINDAEHRHEYYQKTETKVPFDIEMLNTITGGGVSRKTLNILIAGTNVGKSLVMCHMAASSLAQGKNVLYITMEMAEEKIAERIDANLMDIPISQIELTPLDRFQTKIDKIKAKTSGNLIIKEYPTASAHAGHFRALLNEIKMKKGFVPDVIFIDYLNICSSSRFKGSSGDSYNMVKCVAEELRGLAVEFDTVMWSATQFNRQGFSSSDPGMENTSESFGINATADLVNTW